MREDVADVTDMRRANTKATFAKGGQGVSDMVGIIGDEIKPMYFIVSKLKKMVAADG